MKRAIEIPATLEGGRGRRIGLGRTQRRHRRIEGGLSARRAIQWPALDDDLVGLVARALVGLGAGRFDVAGQDRRCGIEGLRAGLHRHCYRHKRDEAERGRTRTRPEAQHAPATHQ